MLDFNDGGITDVLSIEQRFGPGNVGSQTEYFTCSKSAAQNLNRLYGESNLEMLAMGTIDHLVDLKANLLNSKSSLIGISDSAIAQMTTGNTCAFKFAFRNVTLDGLPFSIDLSQYDARPILINPNDVVNNEIHIPVQHLKLKTSFHQ